MHPLQVVTMNPIQSSINTPELPLLEPIKQPTEHHIQLLQDRQVNNITSPQANHTKAKEMKDNITSPT